MSSARPWFGLWLPLGLLLVGGCIRLGFEGREDAPSGAPAEGGGLQDGGPADVPQSSPDALTGGLNEPCDPPPCAEGLVCTGFGDDRYCRPACAFDASVCPDGQTCGRPVVDGGSDPTVPRACMTNSYAGQYQSCDVLPCAAGTVCVKGDTSACLQPCFSASDCAVTESCIAASNSGVDLCIPQCETSADCPGEMQCAGFGEYPQDHCGPIDPTPVGSPCYPAAPCVAGARCINAVGASGGYCYPTCPSSAATCAAGSLCVPTNVEELCVRACDPLGSPTCAAYEICFVDGKLMKAYCIPGVGQSENQDCSSLPCETGLICVDNSCLPACDASHPCPTGKTCAELNYQGTPAPWKACQ